MVATVTHADVIAALERAGWIRAAEVGTDWTRWAPDHEPGSRCLDDEYGLRWFGFPPGEDPEPTLWAGTCAEALAWLEQTLRDGAPSASSTAPGSGGPGSSGTPAGSGPVGVEGAPPDMAQLDESLAWVLPGAARVRRGSGCGADLPFGVRVDVVLEVGETDDVLRPHVYVTGPCGQLFDGPPDDARDWLRDQLGELAAALGGSQ